jgi:hypothetical protein
MRPWLRAFERARCGGEDIAGRARDVGGLVVVGATGEVFGGCAGRRCSARERFGP